MRSEAKAAHYARIGDWYAQARDEYERASFAVQLAAPEMRRDGFGVREIGRMLHVKHSYVIEIIKKHRMI